MIITKQTATKAIKAGKARDLGTTVDQGWRWRIIERLDKQRVDHVRVEPAERAEPR